jgi:hypothetical protein
LVNQLGGGSNSTPFIKKGEQIMILSKTLIKRLSRSLSLVRPAQTGYAENKVEIEMMYKGWAMAVVAIADTLKDLNYTFKREEFIEDCND